MRLPSFIPLILSTVLYAQAPVNEPAKVRNKNKPTLQLTAGGLPDGSSIPRRFTCDGQDVSLPLSWSGEPEGTASFVLIVDDPDGRGFNHWLVWDIPASVHAVAEGVEPAGVSGTNDFGKRGFGGPCPPQGGGAHGYSFRLFALDVPSLNVKPGSHRDVLDRAMRKHVLAKVEYRLLYGRN